MKILFLSRLYKPHVGGVEKHLEKISKKLSDIHQIDIVTELYDENLPLKQTYPEAQIYRIPIGTSEKLKKFLIWKWFLNHFSLLKKSDVIHIHDVWFWILPFFIFFPRKKFFITFHGYEGSKPPGLKQIIWHKVAEWGSAANICIGDFHRRWYRTVPTIVSYGATDANLTTTNTVRKNTLMYLGRLDNDTGILDYLKAVKNIQTKLDIFGDGPLLSAAKKFSKANRIQVNFFGFIPNADAKISDYPIIYTSRYLGILEALVAKRHVIAHFDSPIKYDYLTMAPFAKYISICCSAAEIEAETKKIMQSPNEYQSRVLQGYNWAKQQTWAKLADQYERLWHQVRSV